MLTELSRDGLAEHRLARRANALVLLDRGMRAREIARVLLIDEDTVGNCQPSKGSSLPGAASTCFSTMPAAITPSWSDKWLARPDCRIKLHFIPPYCPYLNPIERLWGVMHRAFTHNRCSPTFPTFQTDVLTFLRNTVPRKWADFRDTVSDNSRVRYPAHFRTLN